MNEIDRFLGVAVECLSAPWIREVLGSLGLCVGKGGLEFAGASQDWRPEFRLRGELIGAGRGVRMLPEFRIFSDEVARFAEDMCGGDVMLIGKGTNLLLRQQLQNAGFGLERAVDWVAIAPEEVPKVMDEMLCFFRARGVAFIRDISSRSALLLAYESGDSRLPNDARFHLYAAACYVADGRLREAHNLLTEHFGKPARRRRYAEAFKYVEERLPDQN
jgi:hypothetical protein